MTLQLERDHNALSFQLTELGKQKLDIHLAYNPQLWKLCSGLPLNVILTVFSNKFLISVLAGRLPFSSGTDFPLQNFKRTILFPHSSSLMPFPINGNIKMMLCDLLYSLFSKATSDLIFFLLILPSELTCNITSQRKATYTDHSSNTQELFRALSLFAAPTIFGQCSLEFRGPSVPLAMFSGQKVNALAELKAIKINTCMLAAGKQVSQVEAENANQLLSDSVFSKASASHFNIPQVYSHGKASFRTAVNINFISDYAYKR